MKVDAQLAYGRHVCACPQINPARLLTSGQIEQLASKDGPRRTVYFTKQLPDEGPPTGEKRYARTQQYLGEWKNNKWDGKGTLEKADGTRYVGEWLDGKRHGVGTLWHRHKDGSLRKVYSGHWVNDVQTGRGTMNYATGDVFVGDWDKGQRHGVGICTYAAGGVYEGEWWLDKRHGFGVYDYPNGDHFEGHWVDDSKEGQGVHFYFSAAHKAHSKRYDGEWVDDVPKCGAYTEMPRDALAPDSQCPDPLPGVQLIDPEGVLASRLAEVRAERAQHRAKRVNLEEHFTPEELEALRAAFERLDAPGKGALSRGQLAEAFQQVGMAPTEEAISSVLSKLQKDTATSFTFADFAQAADLLSPVEM